MFYDPCTSQWISSYQWQEFPSVRSDEFNRVENIVNFIISREVRQIQSSETGPKRMREQSGRFVECVRVYFIIIVRTIFSSPRALKQFNQNILLTRKIPSAAYQASSVMNMQ